MNMIATRSVKQESAGQAFNSREVLEGLREQMRDLLDLPYVPRDTLMKEAEFVIIDSICKRKYNGPADNILLRAKFQMEGYEYYRRGLDGLPHHIVRTYQLGVKREDISKEHGEAYRECLRMQLKPPAPLKEFACSHTSTAKLFGFS